MVSIPLIVERSNLSDACQLRWNEVSLEIWCVALSTGTSREHGNSGRTSGIVALQELIEDAVCGDAPVICLITAPVAACLKFVAEAPHHYRRVIAVALHPFLHKVRPYLHEWLASTPIVLVTPFVNEFVNNENADLIGNVVEVFGVRIV